MDRITAQALNWRGVLQRIGAGEDEFTIDPPLPDISQENLAHDLIEEDADRIAASAGRKAAQEFVTIAHGKQRDPVVTFRSAAEHYIDAHAPSWSNAVFATQWPSSLASYVYAAIGDIPVSKVTTEQVVGILKPIWSTKTETASRVHGQSKRY